MSSEYEELDLLCAVLNLDPKRVAHKITQIRCDNVVLKKENARLKKEVGKIAVLRERLKSAEDNVDILADALAETKEP